MSFKEYLIKVLIEKKDHFIKNNTNLNDDQKTQIIKLLNKYPHLEKEIDWNKSNELNFDNFKPLFDIRTKTGVIKKVKEKGISGLIEGKDYINFPISKGQAYIPLTHQASVLIASKRIGSCEGEWCTAEQKDNKDWIWRQLNERTLIYIILNDTKYAVELLPKNNSLNIIDAEDNYINEIPGIDIKNEIKNNFDVIEKVRKIIQDRDSVYEKFNIKNYKENDDGTVDVDGNVNISQLYDLEKLPIKFRKVMGDFYCYENSLISLDGAPVYVGGNFNCSYNELNSLKGSPRNVGGNFNCSNNKLSTFNGAPTEVGGDFECKNSLPSYISKEEISLKVAYARCKVHGKIIT